MKLNETENSQMQAIDTKVKSISSSTQAARLGLSVIATVLFLFLCAVNSQAETASAAFTTVDTTTQGNWQSKYGSDGYAIANSSQSMPSYAAFTPQNQMNWTWAAPTTDPRGLQTSSGRVGTTWYSGSTFSLDINLADQNSHQVALYAVDWDQRYRSETIQIVDANSGAQLDARSISGFQNGMYLVWNICGHVKVNVTVTGGPNGVISGVFFGAGSTASSSNSAVFVTSDTASQGSWKAKYGADGYSIAAGQQNVPSYASFALRNQSNWTWATNTSDPRALQAPSGPAIAATWYSSSSFTMDVNMTDGKSHQFAIYALDWDMQGRAESVQIVDANTGAVLNTQNISNFTKGVYLVWMITGHVQVNVTLSSWPNAVVSGVFFGGANSNTSNPTSTAPPTTPAAPATTLVLSASTKSLSFPSVTVSSTSTQTVTFTNAGSANVTISGVSVSGAGFNATGSLNGTTLVPGQSASLTATFSPATSGNATGSITVASNATNGATVIALSGSGVAPTTHTVNLSWAPSSSQVTGYNVYVSLASGSGYTKLNSSPVATPDYSDSGLQTAQTRYYVVTSVNSSNQESAYSNEVSAIVP